MIRSRRIAVVAAIVLSLSLPSVRADSDPNTKIADRFDVSLDSARYATSTQVIRSSEGRSERAIERLRLNCEVDIADANLVLGISRRGAITRLTNGKGEIVEDFGQRSLRPSSVFYSYQGLRYRPQFVPPQKPARWKTAIRSILRLPPLKSSRPQRLDKLAPSPMMLELDAGLFGPDAEKISRVEGHFYVLMAESLEHVDVPFKPAEKWRRVVPGLEIKVLEAESSESRYKYRIEARREENAVQGWLSPATDLPERLAAERQLIGRDGKLTRHRIGPLPLSLHLVGSGSGSGSGRDVGPIKKFRFVIAVKPRHHKIPFVLEDIPLPGSPEATAKASESARAAAARARAAAVRAARARRRAQPVPYSPTSPMSQSVLRQTWIQLRWEPGPGADSYDVYPGESFEDVNDGVNGTFLGNQTGTFLIAGFRGFPYPDGLVPGKTYYWRVDEINKSGANSPPKGEVRSLSIAPRAAFDPFPADGAHSRPAADPTETALNPLASVRQGFSQQMSIDSFMVRNLTQNRRNIFHLNCVPRHDVPHTYKGKVWSFTVKEGAESRQVKD